MAAYNVESFAKGDKIVTENGLSYVVISNGVAGQRALTCKTMRKDGTLGNKNWRVDVKAVSLRSPVGGYDGLATPDDVMNKPRYEGRAVTRGRTEPVAAVPPVERFRLRMGSAYATTTVQGRMF